MPSLLFALFISFVLALLCLKFGLGRSQKAALLFPRGPPADPIIGHARLIPSSRPELTYMQWGKTYNTDIVYLSLLGQPVFVLNKVEDAIALLDKRGGNYSSRPKLPFFEEMGWRQSVLLFPIGPDFRRHRKMFQKTLTTTNCIQFQDAQQQEARKLVHRIIRSPDKWRLELVTFATAVILRIAYGITVKGEDDPFVELANKVSKAVSDGGSAGATAVDIFPFVRYFPQWASFLVPSLAYARKYYPWVRKMHEFPYATVKNEMENGTAEPSFTGKMIQEMKSKAQDNSATDALSIITEGDIQGAGATIYNGGQDTTWSTLACFILAMTKYPEVQRKAWTEIESVVGNNRLPTFSDRQNLPYVEHVVQETFRWKPVVPLVVPHKTSEDDTYKGFFIPKGSLVIANDYAMTHDESIYHKPDIFNPDRYLSKEKQGAGEPFPIGNFGFGRRVCPGQYLGTASVWMAIVTMLSTLEISKAEDKNGQEIEPSENMSTGLVSHPEVFPCSIKSRSPNTAIMLEKD